ncbi:MAG: siroheme synthase [Deltaproteobacteria bacterium RIFOXYD12_FULL_50_9]|nr:MAG: siroheme synthase [Deltaproteobacteria bacterium RIFOXYD12_FULL_50_9]
MSYFSICLDIADKRCIVIGGGRVAERKVGALLEHGGRITVVSPQLTPELTVLVEKGRIFWQARGYCPGDLVGAFLVIAATDDPDVQQAVHVEATERNILLNVADVPKWCNFILPAMVRRGDLSISVSTGGKSPALARALRRELEESYGREYALAIELLGAMRPAVLAQGQPHAENKLLFEAVLDPDLVKWIRHNEWSKIETHLRRTVGNEIANTCMTAMRKRLSEEKPSFAPPGEHS